MRGGRSEEEWREEGLRREVWIDLGLSSCSGVKRQLLGIGFRSLPQ